MPWTAEQLATWLREHRHDDVEVVDENEVASTKSGRRRAYVLSNDTRDQLVVGDDYWRMTRGART